MTTVDFLILIDGGLGGALLIYDDAAWAVATGVMQVMAWMLALFAAIGGVAGGLGYLAGLALG